MALAEVVGSQGAAFARQASFASAAFFKGHGKVIKGRLLVKIAKEPPPKRLKHV